VASSILRLQRSQSSAELLQFLYFNILLAFMSTEFVYLSLGLTNVLPFLFILSMFSLLLFHPSSSSHNPPTGVFWYSWLALCLHKNYKFHDCTTFATVRYPARVCRFSLRLYMKRPRRHDSPN
jgi:hypothetical protein